MAFSPDGERCLGGVVVYDLYRQAVIETRLAWRRAGFPYVPGLLSFREAPATLAAIRKLKRVPDVFMFDAHGQAHPRRFGLASHAGVLIDRPTIGCAKSRLCGTHDEPRDHRGAMTPLIHDDEEVGVVLRTRAGVKPVFVSVGHLLMLDDAVRIVLQSGGRFRLPEPTRLAHQLVTAHRTDSG